MMVKRYILICLACLMYSCEKCEINDEPKPGTIFYTNKILRSITWEVYGKETGLHDDFITCLAIDKQNNKWIGTYSNGIAKFGGENWEIFTTSNSGLPNDSIEEITFDRNGILWIATKKSGVVKFNEDGWVIYKDADFLGSNNKINSIAVDMDNVKWIAYGHFEEGGLVKFNDTNWTLFTPKNSVLPSSIIDQIHVDKDNRIWLGTHGGLVSIQNGQWTVFNKDNTNMPYNWIWDISSDNYGNIWIGSHALIFDNPPYLHGTLLRYDGNYWYEHKPHESGKSSNRVHSITTDNFGNIWVATGVDQIYGYQILMFNGQDWFVLSDLDPTFPNSYIKDMVVDKDNFLWVASGDIGLIKIEMVFE